MKMYNKPEFYIEEFEASQMVASCNRQPIDTTTKVGQQTVTCIRQGSTETLFNSASECTHYPKAFGYFNATGNLSATVNDGTHTYQHYDTADAAFNAINTAIGGKTPSVPNTSNSDHTKGVYGNWSGYMTYTASDDERSQSTDISIFDGFYAIWAPSGDSSKNCFGAVTAAIMDILGYSY